MLADAECSTPGAEVDLNNAGGFGREASVKFLLQQQQKEGGGYWRRCLRKRRRPFRPNAVVVA